MYDILEYSNYKWLVIKQQDLLIYCVIYENLQDKVI